LILDFEPGFGSELLQCEQEFAHTFFVFEFSFRFSDSSPSFI